MTQTMRTKRKRGLATGKLPCSSMHEDGMLLSLTACNACASAALQQPHAGAGGRQYSGKRATRSALRPMLRLESMWMLTTRCQTSPIRSPCSRWSTLPCRRMAMSWGCRPGRYRSVHGLLDALSGAHVSLHYQLVHCDTLLAMHNRMRRRLE